MAHAKSSNPATSPKFKTCTSPPLVLGMGTKTLGASRVNTTEEAFSRIWLADVNGHTVLREPHDHQEVSFKRRKSYPGRVRKSLRLRSIMIDRHFHANIKVQTAMCKDNNNSKAEQLHT